MQLPVFEQAYFLQSLGWAIANSFWQTGLLWIIYLLIVNIDKRIPALFKYHLSIGLLFTGFAWFTFTCVQNYGLLTNVGATPEIILFHTMAQWVDFVNRALPLLSIAYLVALSGFLVKFGRNLSTNYSLQTAGLVKAPIDFRLFVNQRASNLGIKKKIEIWFSMKVDVPSVTGFFTPVILLPAAIASHLSVQQIEAILLHELAHIRRNDYLINLLQSIIELILFFNPFIAWLSKIAKKERENCCDDWVMNFQYDQFEYAKALLVLEEQRHLPSLRFALAATSGKNNLLLNRVKRLFNSTPQTIITSSQKVKLAAYFLLLVVVIFTLLPVSTNKPVYVEAGLSRNLNKKEKLHLANPTEKRSAENLSRTILKTPLLPAGDPKRPVARIKVPKKQPSHAVGEDYVNAFINEALLDPTLQELPIPALVVDSKTGNSKYIIIVEEQQSGKKETNTYYYEIDEKDGIKGIKPLLMLNKIKATVKKPSSPVLIDTMGVSKKPLPKKRITS